MKIKKCLSKLWPYLHPKYLGFYILISAIIASTFFYRTKMMSSLDTISVNGVAYRNVEADSAVWNLTIIRKETDRQESFENLKKDKETLIEYLTDQGFTEAEIKFQGYETTPVYEEIEFRKTNNVIWYNSLANYRIETNDIAKISQVSANLNEFIIYNNIEISRNDLQYLYTALENIKIDLLKEAFSDARNRADSLGELTNMKILKVSDLDQGVFQVNPAGDYSVSSIGNFDTTSVKKVVKATISVDFLIR